MKTVDIPSAEDLKRWAIVTAGTGAYYLVNDKDPDLGDTPSEGTDDAGIWLGRTLFYRAYRWIEHVQLGNDGKGGGATRAVLPIGLWSSAFPIALDVKEAFPLLGFDDEDRQQISELISAAEQTRASLRRVASLDDKPRLVRPGGRS